MARPAPPVDTVRVAISGTVFTHKWTNVQWLKLTSSGTRTVNDLATILDGVRLAWATRFAPQLGSNLGGTITVEGVWQTGALTILDVVRTGASTPSGASSVADAAACIVVSWKLGLRYRGGKPRTYLPSVPGSNVTNGSDLTGSALTALAAAAVSYMADINALTSTNVTAVQLGTVSFFSNGGSETQPPTYRTPPVFEAFTGSGIRTKLGSQRRRILT
jgi:hypothetical protein